MQSRNVILLLSVGAMLLSSCGRLGFGGNANNSPAEDLDSRPPVAQEKDEFTQGKLTAPTTSIFTALNQPPSENVVKVNRYLWQASLQVLDFLPIESVDPFTGVIVTGYGTPPGGGRAYRATILIDDPALAARSLKLALSSRSGPVSDATVRAVEDAIMTRARQLRVGDSKL